MPVTKQQYDAVMKISRANGYGNTRVDLKNSTKHSIRLVNPKKGKVWIVDGQGKISKA